MDLTRLSGWQTISGARVTSLDSNGHGRQNKAVALKVLARDNNRCELTVQKRILNATHDVSRYIVNLLDNFELEGDKGTCLRLVLEVMWQDASRFCRGFNPDKRVVLTQWISRHILQGLDFLHTTGIIHDGEILVPSHQSLL